MTCPIHLSSASSADIYFTSLITSPDQRLNVDGIKAHPFFYGVDWESIRNIDAPFVPHLRSITDTSYFPTDELDSVPDQPVGADADGTNKDLAFLGCVFLRGNAYHYLTVYFTDIPSRDLPSRLRRPNVSLSNDINNVVSSACLIRSFSFYVTYGICPCKIRDRGYRGFRICAFEDV